MAPIRRFSSKEKGKVPLEEPTPLPPKKRLHHRRVAEEGPLVIRPWAERPPPGFPVPLYPRAQDARQEDVTPPVAGRARSRAAVAVRPAGAQLHAEGSPREFIVWAAVAPRTWIRLPRSFATLLPPRGPVKVWLQHVGCRCRASVADVEVVSSGDVFMMHGWGVIARACCPWGATAIHLELDEAFTLRFKVFNEDGRRLECRPEPSNRCNVAPGGELALGLVSDSPNSSSSTSPESDDSPETSDVSFVPPSFRRARG